MKSFLLTIFLAAAIFSGCDVQSGITKRSVDGYVPTPVPSVSPTATPVPIDPADVVQVDTSVQGPLLSVNRAQDKTTLNCDKYNRVMINARDTEVTINGACSQVMINGENNRVTLEAAMEIVLNGTGNTVRYTSFANGKRPTVTDNKTGNTVEKIARK